jgi:DNA-binding GntR family transcriptional regulator
MSHENRSPLPAPGGISVHDALRRLILNLSLEPGAELDEAPLSQRFGVSRTPVREALIRLSSEGLVTLQRGRGARVAPLDIRCVRDFFEGLDILQRAVTHLAAIRRTQACMDEIERYLLAFEIGAAALDSDAVNQSNYDFHIAIGRAAHSAHLSHAYSRTMAEGLRFSYLCFSQRHRTDKRLMAHLEMTQREHREIFSAIRAQDPDTAERIAGDHVRLFKKRMSDVLVTPGLTETIRAIQDTS